MVLFVVLVVWGFFFPKKVLFLTADNGFSANGHSATARGGKSPHAPPRPPSAPTRRPRRPADGRNCRRRPPGTGAPGTPRPRAAEAPGRAAGPLKAPPWQQRRFPRLGNGGASGALPPLPVLSAPLWLRGRRPWCPWVRVTASAARRGQPRLRRGRGPPPAGPLGGLAAAESGRPTPADARPPAGRPRRDTVKRCVAGGSGGLPVSA